MEIARPIPAWRPSTPAVVGRSIDELARQHPAIAIHFWATWNGHDPPMDQSIRQIAERFADRVFFVSVDVDLAENLDLCRRFRVANLPALGFLLAGHDPRLIAVGYRGPERLATEIDHALNEREPKPWWVFRRTG